MKTPVKELLTSRLAIIALALAAIVGMCAFSFSGVQDNAWADDEEVIDTWTDLNTDNNSDSGTLELVISWSAEKGTWLASITNHAGDPIPPSTLNLTTRNGTGMAASFKDEIGAGGTVTAEIEGSVATTGFMSAQLVKAEAPEPATVTVTYNLNGYGAFPDGTTLNEDRTATIVAVDGAVTSPVPTDPDNDFGGWFNEDGTEFTGSVAVNTIVYAQWTPKEKVTVTFESEFGTAPEAITVNKGQVVELPNLGTDGDYEFVGWVEKGSEGTDPFIGEYTAEEDITFSAVWKTPSTPATEMVDVIFDMNGHGKSVTKQTEKGKPITLIDDPAADGYTFKGWTYDKEGKQAFDSKKNADQETTLYAQWEKNADPEPDPDTPSKPSDNPADKPSNNGNGSNATKPTETTPTDFIIVVSKTDAKTGKALSGAEFTLADKAGNVVDSWTSDGTSKTFTLDRGTSYVLTETKAPTGYNREKAININFSTDDGKAAVKIDQGGRAVALPVNNDGNAALNVKDLSGTALQGTSTTAPKTGDNQNMPLASLCFGAAALIAGGIAATAYRKRQSL